MDKLLKYADILTQVLRQESSIQPRLQNLKISSVCDRETGHFLIIMTGWQKKSWVDTILFHARLRENKIIIIEAKYYEIDYQKTRNKWNIPNISSHWRKANNPNKALESTEKIRLDNFKENKLKSAILTTRGGAFRDIGELNEAEQCAKRAIKFQPSSHHPYTLMGAICYDRYEHLEGNKWFAEAIKRGASPESIDSEIKNSIAKMKNKEKRNKMIRDLLEKDSYRYSWANKYLSKNSSKKKKKVKN